MRLVYRTALLFPIMFSCGKKSDNSPEPVPSAEKTCRANPKNEWKDGVCRERAPELTDQQKCEQDPTKEWKDGSCQNKPTEPPRYLLAQKDVPGIWNSSGCTFTELDGGTWQKVILNIGDQGRFTILTLLFPSEKCDFYRSDVTQSGQYTFNEADQTIKLQFESCKFKRISPQQEQDCKGLTKEQTFEVFGESSKKMEMNELEFTKG